MSSRVEKTKEIPVIKFFNRRLRHLTSSERLETSLAPAHPRLLFVTLPGIYQSDRGHGTAPGEQHAAKIGRRIEAYSMSGHRSACLTVYSPAVQWHLSLGSSDKIPETTHPESIEESIGKHHSARPTTVKVRFQIALSLLIYSMFINK